MKKVLAVITSSFLLAGILFTVSHTSGQQKAVEIVPEPHLVAYDAGPGPQIVVNPTPTSTNTTNS